MVAIRFPPVPTGQQHRVSRRDASHLPVIERSDTTSNKTTPASRRDASRPRPGNTASLAAFPSPSGKPPNPPCHPIAASLPPRGLCLLSPSLTSRFARVESDIISTRLGHQSRVKVLLDDTDQVDNRGLLLRVSVEPGRYRSSGYDKYVPRTDWEAIPNRKRFRVACDPFRRWDGKKRRIRHARILSICGRHTRQSIIVRVYWDQVHPVGRVHSLSATRRVRVGSGYHFARSAACRVGVFEQDTATVHRIYSLVSSLGRGTTGP